MWRKEFESLDLCGGTISFLCNDCEDMMEIRYPDGMLIDVGKAENDGIYYVTVVASDDVAGWQHPLYEMPVPVRAGLYSNIQHAINRYRRQ